MIAGLQITVFLAALAFVWPFVGAVIVCVVTAPRARDVALWMAGIGCALAMAVFVFPASGGASAGWDDDPVQRAGRVMLAFGLLLNVLDYAPALAQDRLLRTLPHISTALAGLACVAANPAIGLGIVQVALAWGVFVLARRPGQAMAGWALVRAGSVGTFLALSGLMLPAGTLGGGLMMACGLSVLAGLAFFGPSWRDANSPLLFVPLAGAALLLAMRMRTHGGMAFEAALVAAGLLCLWLTACSSRLAQRWHLLRSFPLALGVMAVGVGADVAALLFLCGWCLAGGGRAGQGWAVRAVTCFPPGAPFVGCLLLLSVMADWSWLVAVLSVAGVLICLARAMPAHVGKERRTGPMDGSSFRGDSNAPVNASGNGLGYRFWPDDPAGRLACAVLTAMGLVAPLAMMLGAF
ncbi:hypothetical protein K2X14_01295 [Acetobacter sp. TBRC 12305]|uniref:Uncharacterized protein n=1 Tax=Acetobacter garciniae TaxID=2817435 RepID=A0A939HG48_9PROT|nr:hypothetical protein [Acetobacter garciniae]MBO1323788.1 hypothetical protein [Acetobacter garciniae]MBX0343477.1 hypothetical protein [Acetobacter garciniae]